jgi:hypothetical protein
MKKIMENITIPNIIEELTREIEMANNDVKNAIDQEEKKIARSTYNNHSKGFKIRNSISRS